MTDSSPLIIFHANCLDGFGSAYSAWVHFQLNLNVSAEYLPAAHGDTPPAAHNRTVYLLDYAYKREGMEQLCQQAAKVIVLDHHITAVNELAGMDQQFDNLELHFDMERSGAMITWEYFHSTAAPKLIACVQDRDMWWWNIPESHDVNAGLMSQPFTFERWHEAVQDEQAFQCLVNDGNAINRYRTQMIEQGKRAAEMGTIAGHRVPIVNCPRAIVSELVGELAEGHPFAAGYSDKGLRRSWSLRSAQDGADVAQIAQQFGGGGHKNAAGFVTWLGQDNLVIEPGSA
ncbi:DHH family phosphoesterase [Ketobacter sp.]|uniref:DHH family phosphoesterase n=1 Tax=Ketobacter sp. TaxID=2083498 RepID=UPI000F16D15E|nr:phosphoesterase [Ketobacter sp.]RLT96339.1 MAG: phosphoesterase [Ketobacter sp.]